MPESALEAFRNRQKRRDQGDLPEPSSKGEICLLMIYAKAVRENIPAHILKAIAEELKHE